MLARIKLDLPALRKAILELDDEKLSVDELKAISRQLPTTDEVRRHVLSVYTYSSFHAADHQTQRLR